MQGAVVALWTVIYCVATGTSSLSQLIPCTSTFNVDVRWTQTDTSSHVYLIYINGSILSGIRNRFSIKSTVAGEYNLVMERVNPSDAGLYVCDERNPVNGSRNVLKQFHLDVLERDDDEHIAMSAFVGDDVWMNCSYSSEIGTDVDWRYQRHRGPSSAPVYQGGHLQYGFQDGRLTARKHSPRLYSLVVSNITVTDSGIYLCIEERGQGRTHYFILNVTAEVVFPEVETTELRVTTTTDQLPSVSSGRYIGMILVAVMALALLIVIMAIIAYRRYQAYKQQRNTSGRSPIVIYSSADDSKRQLAEQQPLRTAAAADQSPLTVRMTKRLTPSQNAQVIGLTLLRDKIYVVHSRSHVIAVSTSQEPFTRLQDIVVHGLKRPVDIAASNFALYVPDILRRVVWRIAVEGKAEPFQWLSEVYVGTLSVASDERLVLLVCDDQKGSDKHETLSWRGEVHIYSPDAVRETVVILPQHLVSPLHVVMTKKDTFFVSYGLRWHTVNGVCEVDMTGRVLNAFAFEPDDIVDQFKVPSHLSVVDDDWLIVADRGNDRLLLLSKYLKLGCVLVTWNDRQSSSDEVRAPRRLHYDSHTRRVLVGLASGHIDIYEIT